MPKKSPFWTFTFAGLLLILAILWLVPSASQAVLSVLRLVRSNQPAPAYNGFDAFIPFIPGVFPDEFEITLAKTDSQTTSQVSIYTETYASDTHFFKTIQQMGPAVPQLQPDPGFTIQGQPASLTNTIDLAQQMDSDPLDLRIYDTQEIWLVSVVLKGIHIQLITNLPKETAIQVSEGLIPSICTSTPTPEE